MADGRRDRARLPGWFAAPGPGRKPVERVRSWIDEATAKEADMTAADQETDRSEVCRIVAEALGRRPAALRSTPI